MIRIPLNIQRFADGKVVIDTDLDKKGFENGLNKIQSIAKTGFKAVATSVGVAATAITALVGTSVKAYAEFEQLEGGLISLFGKGSTEMNSILEKSKQAYKDLTMSQNDYLTNFQSAYPLVNAGLNSNKDAIEYTNKVLQLSSDLFNTYGGNVEYYQNAINWALKGSFVYLDNLNLGIKGTQEGFIEAANASGILGRNIESVAELTSDEIIDVIQHYAKEYGVWGKTGQEASETIIGSLNMVRATWKNLISGFSQKDADIGGLFDNLIKSATTFMDNVMPVVERALGSISDNLPTIIEKLVDALPGAIEKLLPGLINSAISLVKSLADALPKLLSILMNSIVKAITGITEILPQITESLIQGVLLIITEISKQLPTLIPLVVDTILKMVDVIIDNVDLFIDAALALIIGLSEGLITALPRLIEKVPILIEKLVAKLTDPEMLGKLVQAAAMLITQLAIALVMSIPSLLKGVKKINDAIINGLKNILVSVGSIGSNIAKGIWSGISNSLSWIKSKIKGWVGNVVSFMKKLFGIHSPSKLMRDEIGKYMAQGIAVGFDDEIDSVYKDMQNALDIENAKIQASVESGKIFNTLVNSTPISISLDGSVEMDSQKVGRIITPVVSRTIKTGGGN